MALSSLLRRCLERLGQIKAARGAGSITPGFFKIEKVHMADVRIKFHQRTVIEDAGFCPIARTWTVTINPPISGPPSIDDIYFATGIQKDFAALPMLQQMLADYPIHGDGGLPCLK